MKAIATIRTANRATARRSARAELTLGDGRWAAVVARDPAADGQFVYAVSSTGVYCRPSCASRTPRPQNVEFHADGAAAERAGYRPCKRCRPDLPPSERREAVMVAGLCRLIDRAESAPSVAELARVAGLSASRLHRVFKAATGLTPMAYAEARRRRRVRDELPGARSVTDAIYGAGFGSSGRFYEHADRALGMTPTRFRAGGAQETIRFAVGDCSLGSILVAATPRGVCAILLGDEPEALLHSLQDRFPRAEMVGGDAEFEQLVARVVGLVEAPGTGIDLPLDIRGTAFQQRVWKALRDLPAGARTSYSELARRIGSPTAVRAVARACAANPLAVAIPCHRVVRSDGSLSGYRWGIERKQALLQRESGAGSAS